MKNSSLESHGLPAIQDRAAGIDVGSRFHVVAVSADITADPVQTFKAFAADLDCMAIGWL
ncbi:TPA: IS110 family transposase, partial [Pseudomonas aeruginosa]|nr:IS110 family transposase [Pseudomonas aeruginosa]